MNKDRLEKWKLLAEKELKDNSIDSLNWETPEDINIKPLYTENDLKNLNHLNELPGLDNYSRGPRATMYAGRPWTLRQYAGFSRFLYK